MRGIDLVAAVTVLAEIGDLSRFQTPRELMGYLGLVPSESSTGDTVNRGGITKAGNGRARRILVEAAWSYRYPPRVSCEKQIKVAAAPRAVREIAWKAQMRLCGRSRPLLCTIHRLLNFTPAGVENVPVVPAVLDKGQPDAAAGGRGICNGPKPASRVAKRRSGDLPL
jgi:hypothetical protein